MDAAEPFANALDTAKTKLVDHLNSRDVLEGEIDLESYKGEDSAFKFPEHGLNIVITPRYTFHTDAEDKQLEEAMARLDKAEKALKKAKVMLKARQDLLIASGSGERKVTSHTVALRKIDKTSSSTELF